MPAESFISTSVTTDPQQLTDRLHMVNTLWSSNISPETVQAGHLAIDSFLDYYLRQRDVFYIEHRNDLFLYGDPDSEELTHGDMLGIAKGIVTGSPTRDAAMQQVQNLQSISTVKASGNDDATSKVAGTLINWAARLVTMIEIGKLDCAYTSRKPLDWQDQSLRDFVQSLFGGIKEAHDTVRLEKNFTARNVEQFAGIEIVWTSDLARHLSLIEDDTQLLVFHHASFLENTGQTDDLFPENFRSETLRTLALLLPSRDKGTRKWFKNQKAKHGLDFRACEQPLLRADDRQIEKFHYWRERISILKKVFDEAEPSTISQWWHDRRRGPQWYTFWVAIIVLVLTVFFGLVQCIEGAMQVYLSWKP